MVITTLKKIGIEAINRESRNATKSVIEALGDIYIKALESDFLLSSDVGRAVGLAITDLVEVSLEGKLEFTQEYVAEPITNICLLAIKKARSKPNFQNLMMGRIEYDLIAQILRICKRFLISEKDFPSPIKTINILRSLIKIGIEIAKIEMDKRIDRKISTYMGKNIISIFDFAFKDEKKELLQCGLIQPVGNMGFEISAKYTSHGFCAEPEDIKNLDLKLKNELEIEYKWILCLLGEIGIEIKLRIKSSSLLIDLERDVGEFIIEIGDECIMYDILQAAEDASKILENLDKELNINDLVKDTLNQHPKFKDMYGNK